MQQSGRNDVPRPDEIGDWDQYKKLVLDYMERVEKRLESIDASLTTMKIEIAMLQVKSGLWGAAAGAIVVVTAVLVAKLR